MTIVKLENAVFKKDYDCILATVDTQIPISKNLHTVLILLLQYWTKSDNCAVLPSHIDKTAAISAYNIGLNNVCHLQSRDAEIASEWLAANKNTIVIVGIYRLWANTLTHSWFSSFWVLLPPTDIWNLVKI